jgi:uncharacterized protein YqgC (DUF456 family)
MASVEFWIALIIMMIGFLGCFLPILPGTPIIFISALGYAFYEDFQKVTPLILGIIFFIMALTLVVDYISGVMGAKTFGASRYGTWGSFFGGIIGVVLFNIPGLLLGPFIGAILGEKINGTEFKESLKIGLGTVIGMAGGAFFKALASITMIIVFITSVV